ncbi:MAG: hypothetical protein JST26_02895 [Bacteroidetes bacterium]|nr:hypothetical protein [Bacteroidota bacterium]
MFTTGKIIFAIIFIIGFILAMVWSFKKDGKINAQHYKNTSKTFILILLVFIALFLFVKFRKML